MFSGESEADKTKDDIDVGKQSMNLNLHVGLFDDESIVKVASENCGVLGLETFLAILERFLYSSKFSGKVIALIQSCISNQEDKFSSTKKVIFITS
jgi:hypothetical protein